MQQSYLQCKKLVFGGNISMNAASCSIKLVNRVRRSSTAASSSIFSEAVRERQASYLQWVILLCN